MATNVTKTEKQLLEEAKQREARKAELAARRAEEREKREGESKADAFKRIALRRTNSALDAIASLRSLSAKGNYDYTPEQFNKITAALRAEVDKVEADFQRGGPAKNESGFDL